MKRILYCLLLVGVFGAAGAFQSTDQFAGEIPQFNDVRAGSGVDFVHINGEKTVKNYIFEAKGGGVGLFDYDNDGLLDLLLVQGSTVERYRQQRNPHAVLYRNLGNWKFEDVTERAGLTVPAWGMGVTFGDYDNDGFADVYLTNLGANVLYRNNGNGTFSDVTARAGVGDSRWSSSSTFADYDRDGDLDLYVCNYITVDFNNLPEPGSSEYCFYKGRAVLCGPRGLPGSADVFYRNNGDGTFTDVTERAGLTDKDRLYGLGVVWADVDNDGDPDLYVANDDGPNLFYLNKGDGTFEEMGFLSGLAVSMDGRNQGSMGVDIADFDNDGLLDVFLTHFAADYNTLYKNHGNLLFEDITGQTPMLEAAWYLVSWGTRFLDVNHDGWKDILFVNGHVSPFLMDSEGGETYYEPASLFVNDRKGNFRDASRLAGDGLTARRASRGAAFGDVDNDGDLDVVIANLNDSPALLRSDKRDKNHWVMFRVKGIASNRDGIGTRITVTTGRLKQVWEVKRGVSIYSASDPRADFGLGEVSKIDKVRFDWPSGKSQEFTNVDADAHYFLEEGGRLVKE